MLSTEQAVHQSYSDECCMLFGIISSKRLDKYSDEAFHSLCILINLFAWFLGSLSICSITSRISFTKSFVFTFARIWAANNIITNLQKQTISLLKNTDRKTNVICLCLDLEDRLFPINVDGLAVAVVWDLWLLHQTLVNRHVAAIADGGWRLFASKLSLLFPVTSIQRQCMYNLS